jgi:NADPH-dependent 2,4-dienoyl-CoA reductase/sulfur reductase-like enzyme
MSADKRIAIVGAGPAGLAAAAVMREYGLELVVIDEQSRIGGQFLRQPPRTFLVEHWLSNKLYDRAKSVLHAMEDREDIDWRFGSTALGIMQRSPYGAADPSDAGHEVWLQGPSGCELLKANAVLIASGCYERPLGFPGWTLPGVFGAGAIQAFVKSQQFVPGNRFVLAGSHPLQLVVADQLMAAGAKVAAVIFTQRPQQAAALLRQPLAMLPHYRPLVETGKILWRLKRAGVPVMFGRTIVEVTGTDRIEQAIIAKLRTDGRIDHDNTQTIECDCLGVCHGFLASSELARQAGSTARWRDDDGGWTVDHDEWFQTSVANLFVAGEVTGVAGADSALEKGHLAGVGVLRAMGRIDDITARRLARRARRRLGRLDRFARALSLLARPPRGLADKTMTESTTLCRCESISRGEFVRQLMENPHIASSDAAKLLTRVGMGMCQGRLCGDRAAQLIASLRGVAVTDVGPFHAQVPVKPVLLDTLRNCGRRNRHDGDPANTSLRADR